ARPPRSPRRAVAARPLLPLRSPREVHGQAYERHEGEAVEVQPAAADQEEDDPVDGARQTYRERDDAGGLQLLRRRGTRGRLAPARRSGQDSRADEPDQRE